MHTNPYKLILLPYQLLVQNSTQRDSGILLEEFLSKTGSMMRKANWNKISGRKENSTSMLTAPFWSAMLGIMQLLLLSLIFEQILHGAYLNKQVNVNLGGLGSRQQAGFSGNGDG